MLLQFLALIVLRSFIEQIFKIKMYIYMNSAYFYNESSVTLVRSKKHTHFSVQTAACRWCHPENVCQYSKYQENKCQKV